MILQKKPKLNKGFTIVELLIVIVVIGILAAITIVAYNGITNRANNTQAITVNENLTRLAEAFNAEGGRYPKSVAEFVSGCVSTISGTNCPTVATAKAASGSVLNPALGTGATSILQVTSGAGGASGLTTANGKTSAAIYVTGTQAAPTGGVVVSWDYTTGAVMTDTTKYNYFGTATSTSTFYALLST